METIYVELQANWKFLVGEKNGKHYCMFDATDEQKATKGTMYRVLVFNDGETLSKKLAGERVDADQICWIKEMTGENGTRFSGILFNNDEKRAFFVNVYENKTKGPGSEYDKLLKLKETEWKERSNSIPDKFPEEIA